MRRFFNWLGQFLLGLGYDPNDDPGAWFDNLSGDPCPACGAVATECELDGMTHDPCLGHIVGASSACCGHGSGPGFVMIGEWHQ